MTVVLLLIQFAIAGLVARQNPLKMLRTMMTADMTVSYTHLHGPLHFAAQSPHVYADTPQQKYRQRIVLAHEHIEQVQRVDSLIALLPGKRHRSLQRLLRRCV